MAYAVRRKYVPPTGGAVAPGEHYTVVDPNCGVSWYGIIHFYRTPKGREVATDDIGERLAQDGPIYLAVKAAVDQYDLGQR
jgi:hypothetical protein